MSKLTSLWLWCRGIVLVPFLSLLVSLSVFLVPYSPKEWLSFSDDLEVLETKLIEHGAFSQELEGWFKEVYEIERKEGVAILMNKDQGELADLLASKYETLRAIEEQLIPFDLSLKGLSDLKRNAILVRYAQEHGFDLFVQESAFGYLSRLLNLLQYGGVMWCFLIAFTSQLYRRRQQESLARWSFNTSWHRWLVSCLYGLVTYLLPTALVLVVFLAYGLSQKLDPLAFPIILGGEQGFEAVSVSSFLLPLLTYQLIGLAVMHQLSRFLVLLNGDWTLILLSFATGWLPLVLPIRELIWSPFHVIHSFASFSALDHRLPWQGASLALGSYFILLSLGIAGLKKWRRLPYL